VGLPFSCPAPRCLARPCLPLSSPSVVLRLPPLHSRLVLLSLSSRLRLASSLVIPPRSPSISPAPPPVPQRPPSPSQPEVTPEADLRCSLRRGPPSRRRLVRPWLYSSRTQRSPAPVCRMIALLPDFLLPPLVSPPPRIPSASRFVVLPLLLSRRRSFRADVRPHFWSQWPPRRPPALLLLDPCTRPLPDSLWTAPLSGYCPPPRVPAPLPASPLPHRPPPSPERPQVTSVRPSSRPFPSRRLPLDAVAPLPSLFDALVEVDACPAAGPLAALRTRWPFSSSLFPPPAAGAFESCTAPSRLFLALVRGGQLTGALHANAAAFLMVLLCATILPPAFRGPPPSAFPPFLLVLAILPKRPDLAPCLLLPKHLAPFFPPFSPPVAWPPTLYGPQTTLRQVG